MCSQDHDGKTAVVIPCYRVSGTIRDVILSVSGRVDHIIVVDDGCPENSGTVAADLGRPEVLVVKLEGNQGVGGAVIAGYRKALEMGCEFIVKMDGDGQMDAALLERIVGPLKRDDADYVKGNRFRNLGGLRGMPRARLLGNSVLSFLVKIASGYWDVMDPTNGFTAITRETAGKLDLDRVARGYFFETDMLVNLNTVNAVVVDVETPAIYGSEGSSLSVKKELFRFPPKLFRGFLRRIFEKYYLYDFNMASVYLLLGVPVFTASTIFGIFQWIESVVTGEVRSAGTIMLVALPIIVSFQMILQAIHIDIMSVPKRNR